MATREENLNAVYEQNLYWYRARLVRVIDGDTIVVDIDQGVNNWTLDEHVRLNEMDSPEKRGKSRVEGLAAMEHISRLLPEPGETIIIHTEKDKRGSFNRLLVDIYHDGVNVNKQMITDGYAEKW